MTTLNDLAGTRWQGRGELWLDPLGDQAAVCDCTLAVQDGAVTYHWSHESTPHTGTLALRPTGELVLQMTNVAPWGEEVRAVRMTCARS